MRDRRTEEDQHAVPEKLCDRAFVAVDCFANSPMDLLQDFAPLFWVHFFSEGGRADDVRKQGCDRLSGSNDLAALVPDLVSERAGNMLD